MITWSYQTSPFNSQTKFVILLTVNHLYLLSSLIWLILYWYRKGKFCLGHLWELKGKKETVALEQALIIHATGRAFLRPREDLIGSERGLPGCGTRPLWDLSPARVAEGRVLSRGRRHAHAEAKH